VWDEIDAEGCGAADVAGDAEPNSRPIEGTPSATDAPFEPGCWLLLESHDPLESQDPLALSTGTRSAAHSVSTSKLRSARPPPPSSNDMELDPSTETNPEPVSDIELEPSGGSMGESSCAETAALAETGTLPRLPLLRLRLWSLASAGAALRTAALLAGDPFDAATVTT
jgi:hypothetical protein